MSSRRLVVVCLAPLAACGRVGFDPASDPTAGDAPSASEDVDDDGFADTADNCPFMANPAQANEDGDLLGDDCDPCPPFGDNSDPDGDKVGGPCDPNPNTPGDQLVHFAGFQSLPQDLVLFGQWTVSGGQIHVTGSLDELTAATWMVTGARETVSTHVTIDAMFGNLVARPIGVVHEFDASTDDGTVCVFGINPSNSQVCALADNRTTGAIVLQPTPIAVGSSAEFRSFRNGTLYACHCEPVASDLTGTNNLTLTPNRVGLFSRSASATFDWAMVVTSP